MLQAINRSMVRCVKFGFVIKRTMSADPNNMYDNRKYKSQLPEETVRPLFETLPYIPTGVFRSTEGEVLGRCASKTGPYKNPEYFSFHNMTFYDFMIYLAKYRKGVTPMGRKCTSKGN